MYFIVASTIIRFPYGQLHIHHPKYYHCLGHLKSFSGLFFFSLVSINYLNNDYLAASQGASAWQLLIRLPTTTRADWLMPLLLCPAHLCCLASTAGCTQCKSPAASQLSGSALVPSKPTARAAPARQSALGERHGHMETSDEDQRQFQFIA